MRASFLLASFLVASTSVACGGDDSPTGTDGDTTSGSGGAPPGAGAGGVGGGGDTAAGGSGGGAQSVPCDAEGCATYDCACGDGSIFRGYRSCSAQSEDDACPGACAGYGGWLAGGTASPPDVGPLLSSTGVRVGESCEAASSCGIEQWKAICSDGQLATPSLCEGGICADYATSSGIYCGILGATAIDHDEDATGRAFVRTCGGIDWLRFVGSKNVLDDAVLGDAYVEASGEVRVVGDFHGYMDLGAGDESCFDGGLFVATYVQGALTARRAFCFFGRTSVDRPRITKDGVYAASNGSVDWSGDDLIGGGFGYDWTLIHAGLDGGPGWTRHIAKASGAAVHLVSVDDLGAVLFTTGSVTLWGGDVLDGTHVVRVSPTGDISATHTITGMTGTFADVFVGGGSAGHLLLSLFGGYDGDVEFDGATLAPGGASSKRIVAMIGADGNVAWSENGLMATDFHVADDGTSTLLVGSGIDVGLERRDAAGGVVWSKPLPVPTTPHLYYVHSWGAVHVAPSGAIHMELLLGPDEVISFAGVTTTSTDTYPGGVGASYLTRFAADGTPSGIERFTRCSIGGRFVPDAAGTLFVGQARYCLESALAADPVWGISTTSSDTRNGLLLHLRE